MVDVMKDRVRDTSTSGGTGTFTLSGTPPINYRTFSAVCATGDVVPYSIVNRVVGEWEVGIGRYGGSNTLLRQGGDSGSSPASLAKVLASSNAGSLVNFSGSGTQTKDVVLSINSRMFDPRPACVLDYGADPTGATDSTNAFVAAWLERPRIYAPRGKYAINTNLTIPQFGGGLVGDGPWTRTTSSSWTGADWSSSDDGTLIVNSATTGNCFTATAGATFMLMKGFSIVRTSQATTGYGVAMNSASGGTNDFCCIEDVWAANHNVGIHLGSTGHSFAQRIRSEHNRNHGFELGGQWQTNDLYAYNNSQHGYYCASQTGVGASMGQFRGLSSYLNAGYGFQCLGVSSSGARVEALRMSDCFFGGDGQGEIYIDSYGSNHIFTNVWCECDANIPPWQFTANNFGTMNLANCSGTTFGTSGVNVFTCAPNVFMSNCRMQGAPGGGGTTGYGISLVGGSSQKASIIGCNATSSAGIYAQSLAAITILGCQSPAISTTGASNVYVNGNFT